MARIPDSRSLGQRVIPQSRRRIVSDRSGEILGAGIAEFGADVLRMQAREREHRAREQEKKNRFNYATARSDLLQADIELRRTLENDQDWATQEKRYQDGHKAAREKAAGLITDPTDRALFEQESKLDAARGAAEVGSLSRRIEGDQGRATLEDKLAKNREAALTAKDRGTRDAIVDATNGLIEGAALPSASGTVYISKESAGERRRRWIEDYGEGYVDLQGPVQQIAMLQKPDGTPAQFIPADRRAALIDRAQNEIKRREAEARARQGEVRAALRDAEADALAAKAAGLPANLPSRGLYLVAYGDEGAARYGQATQLMATYDAASAAILLPPDEAMAQLSQFKPVQQEGAAAQADVQRHAISLYAQQRKVFEADPVGYIVGTDERAQSLFASIVNGQASKEDVSAYLSRVRSIQDTAGVEKMRILPEAENDAYVKALQPDQAKPGARAAKLAQLEQQWGRHYGELLREVVPKMEGVGKILPYVPAATAARLDALSVDPKPVLDALQRSGRQTEFTQALTDELAGFEQTFVAGVVVGGAGDAADYFEAAKLLGAEYVRTGTLPEKAAKKAVNELVRSQYVIEGALRIPVREDGGRGRVVNSDQVTAGAVAKQGSLGARSKDTAKRDFKIKPRPRETPEEAQADMRALIREQGFWVANEDESGAVLSTPEGVVFGSNGAPIGFTWAELEAVGVKSAESQKREAQLDLTRRHSFGGPR